jgi:hypothetical protein
MVIERAIRLQFFIRRRSWASGELDHHPVIPSKVVLRTVEVDPKLLQAFVVLQCTGK